MTEITARLSTALADRYPPAWRTVKESRDWLANNRIDARQSVERTVA
jgi:hypothetical protein